MHRLVLIDDLKENAYRLVMGWLVSPLVEDAELRERLWTESERLVGLAAF
jgi:hypothetical protein